MPTIFISTLGSAQCLSTERSKSSSGDDFTATILGQLSIAVAATVEKSCDTSTSKSTLCQMSLVVRVFAALAATNNFAPHIVIFIIAIMAIITASAIISLNGVSTISAGVPVFMTIIILLILRAGAVLVVSVFMSMFSSYHDLLSLGFLISDNNHTGLLLLTRRNNDWWWSRRFLHDDLLRLGCTLSNDDGRWWIVRGVVLCFLAVSLNVAAVTVINMLLHPLFDAVLAVVSTLGLDHLVLNLDIVVKHSVEARSTIPFTFTFNFLGRCVNWRTVSIAYLRGCRHRHGRRGWRRISLSLDFLLVDERSRSCVSATVLTKASLRRGGFKGRVRTIRSIRTSVLFYKVAGRAASVARNMGTSIVVLGGSAGCDFVSSDCSFAITLII